ncbi:MAG: alanine racemase [Verrucomicrobiota bacterium]
MDKSALRSWCEVDLRALEHNVRFIRQKVGQASQIMGVVKADAYGHGLTEISKFLGQTDCQIIGVANLSEAQAAQQALPQSAKIPIILLSAALESEYEAAIRDRVILTVSSREEAEAINIVAKSCQQKAIVHLKIDTGMGRLGALPQEVDALKRFIKECSYIKLEGLYSHFSAADSDVELTQRQWNLYEPLADTTLTQHMANSAGFLNQKSSHLDIVRPGLAFYGIAPNAKHQSKLRPALTWKSRVTLLKDFPRGHPISYGATYTTARQTRVAVVSVGYGDGFFRSLSNRGHVLINNVRRPILGRVTMDQIMVDVTNTPGVERGSEVILIGSGSTAKNTSRILASEMAEWAGTIAYEIWCHITPRVQRIYIKK